MLYNVDKLWFMSERNDCHSAKVYNGKEVRKKQDDAISKGRSKP